ncbi:hypothetical protein A2929_01565 [Candidatus Kaiserbacteria bacterium RIFCSPLOWO2_01_FULL_45_25]|nr:MAG: hypothetical protein A2Z56_03635 [Candidatus Kaiserbacteria bacterium RIFCSPHIGHO2_12_45_16]OGG71000.1 MAG: hypothetical protein A2929_01565 [Candidatus Kaiserbacteria bacterium RIFCSPLOWO2_01_FULL_45_25]
MPALNTLNNLPNNLKWYALIKLLLILLLISIPFTFAGEWLNFYWSAFILFILPIWIYLVLSYKFTSFIVSDKTLTINSGILFKRSISISFDQIQNTDSSRGPLSSAFGISRLKIWTASPSQLRINQGNSNNKPDGLLWLLTTESIALKDFISNN